MRRGIMQALRAPARCSLFDKGDALSGGGATRRRRRGGGSGTGNAGRGAAQRQQEERGAKREYADSREAEARWYAVQTQMGRQDDIERFARQKDVVALGGFECHTPMLTQYTRTSKGLLSERKVPVTAGMSIIKFKYRYGLRSRGVSSHGREVPDEAGGRGRPSPDARHRACYPVPLAYPPALTPLATATRQPRDDVSHRPIQAIRPLPEPQDDLVHLEHEHESHRCRHRPG